METPLNVTIGARVNAFLSTAEDFHKYRKRVNKSLLRLRHDLALVTRDTKNYTSKVSTITSQDYEKDSRYGLLVLLTAERDLLYSLEIKSLLEISNENVSSYKNLMISKLKKCCSYSKKLLEITANESDDLKLIELHIYDVLNEGSLAVNKRRWEKALSLFSIARCALEFLYSQPEGEFNKTVVNELIETTVDPSLNLAVSQLEIKATDLKSMSRKYCHQSNSKLVELIEKQDPSYVSEISSSVELIESIAWREHEARLYNDEISFKIMELTKPEVNEYKSLESFDILISGWSKILEIHQTDMSKNSDEDDEEKVQDRAILLTYINYNLLFTRIRRDLILIDELSTDSNKGTKQKKLVINKDITRLYVSIINTIGEVKELPGVYNDDDLLESLDSMINFYNWKKLIRLSSSFLLNEKFLESLKVLNVVDTNTKDIDVLYKVDDFPFSVSSNEDFQNFKKEFNEIYLNNQILGQFSFEASRNNGFTIEKMTQFPISNNIINLGSSTRLESVLSKPVLFDVAFNYINYASSSKAGSAEPQNTSVEEDSGDKKKGFFGIFGRN